MKLFALGSMLIGVIVSLCACGSSDDSSGSAGSSNAGSSNGNAGSSSGGSSSSSGGSSSAAAGSAGKTGSAGSTSSAGSSSGGGSGSESPFSCNDAANGTCASYSSVPPNSASTYCSEGTVVDKCPTDNLQATCSFTSAGTDEVFYYYQSSGFSNAAIKGVCDSENGTLKTF